MRSWILTLLGVVILVLLLSTAAASQQAAVTVAPPAADAPVADLEKKGDDLRAEREYAGAFVYYKAALRKAKNNAVLYNKAAICQLQLKNFGDAKKDFRRAIKKDRNYAEAYNNLGVVFFMLKDYNQAIGQYQKAIQLKPDSSSFHSNLGAAWFSKNEIPAAIAEYTRAIELDPDILARTSAGGSIAHIITPEERAQFFYVLAKIYAQRNDSDRCLDCLRRAKEEKYPRIEDVYKDPAFQSLRADPRLAEVVPPKTQ